MMAHLDKQQFGPWALVTGASSGIGREFARQIAASGINVVLVARREALLTQAGDEFSKAYGIEHRVVVADLSVDGFMNTIIRQRTILISALSYPMRVPPVPASFWGMIAMNSWGYCDSTLSRSWTLRITSASAWRSGVAAALSSAAQWVRLAVSPT